MTAMGREWRNPMSALRQIQFTYPLACKIVCFKADGCKLDLGPNGDVQIYLLNWIHLLYLNLHEGGVLHLLNYHKKLSSQTLWLNLNLSTKIVMKFTRYFSLKMSVALTVLTLLISLLITYQVFHVAQVEVEHKAQVYFGLPPIS